MVPLPCFRIDWFSYCTQNLETGEIIRFGLFRTKLHQGSDCSWSSVKLTHFIFWYYLPTSTKYSFISNIDDKHLLFLVLKELYWVRIWWIWPASQIRQKPISIERRLKSWNNKYNFKWNQPYLSCVSNLSPGSNSSKFDLCRLNFKCHFLIGISYFYNWK